MAPGKFVEVCEKLPKGAKQDATSGANGVLDAALEQDYCWMWTNKQTTAATLDLSFTRE